MTEEEDGDNEIRRGFIWAMVGYVVMTPVLIPYVVIKHFIKNLTGDKDPDGGLDLD